LQRVAKAGFAAAKIKVGQGSAGDLERVRLAMLAEPLAMQNGEIAVPSGPGLGVTVDTRAIEQFAVR